MDDSAIHANSIYEYIIHIFVIHFFLLQNVKCKNDVKLYIILFL